MSHAWLLEQHSKPVTYSLRGRRPKGRERGKRSQWSARRSDAGGGLPRRLVTWDCHACRSCKRQMLSQRSLLHGFGMPLFLKYLNVADAKVFPQITRQYCYEILNYHVRITFTIFGSRVNSCMTGFDRICTCWQLVSFVDLCDGHALHKHFGKILPRKSWLSPLVLLLLKGLPKLPCGLVSFLFLSAVLLAFLIFFSSSEFDAGSSDSYSCTTSQPSQFLLANLTSFCLF